MGGRGHVQHPYLEFRRGGHRRGMGRTTGSSVSVVRIAERAVRAFRVPDNAAELVREAMLDEVQQAVSNLGPRFGSRSIAALAEAMDEMTIKEAENEAPEASGNPQSSGGPVVAEHWLTKAQHWEGGPSGK
uniref:DUF768 domain-containing protein n=1 Tax=Globodera pallida TaxID=36090 RepID=A0A183CA96_GLOPA